MMRRVRAPEAGLDLKLQLPFDSAAAAGFP